MPCKPPSLASATNGRSEGLLLNRTPRSTGYVTRADRQNSLLSGVSSGRWDDGSPSQGYGDRARPECSVQHPSLSEHPHERTYTLHGCNDATALGEKVLPHRTGSLGSSSPPRIGPCKSGDPLSRPTQNLRGSKPGSGPAHRKKALGPPFQRTPSLVSNEKHHSYINDA